MSAINGGYIGVDKRFARTGCHGIDKHYLERLNTRFLGPRSSYSNYLSASLDGTDDYLEVGDIGSAGRSLGAISFWAKPDDQFETGNTSNMAYIIGWKGSGLNWDGLNYGEFVNTTRLFNLYINGHSSWWDVGSSGYKLSDAWHHIVLTHNGTGYTFYVDGQLASDITGTINVGAQSIITGTDFDNLRIGRRAVTTWNFYPFKGKMDEVAIFDSALSAADISAIYNSGTPAGLSTYSPDIWWRMGDGAGDTDSGGGAPADSDTIGTIADQAGSNHATGSGGSTFSTDAP